MKVIYDYQIFRTQRYGGISRYFTNLIQCSDKDSVLVPVFHSKNYYFNKLYDNFDHKYESMLVEKLNNWISKYLTRRTLRKHQVDIFHPTNYDSYFLRYLKNEKVVITVHDLGRELFPQYYGNKDTSLEEKKKLIDAANHIIAVSNNTKEDIIRFYHIDPDKITVVYHGLPLRFGKVNITLRGLPERYILFVGQRTDNKNFKLFLEAMSIVLLEDETLNLLCVGGGEFTENERKDIARLGINKQVGQRNLNDEVLAACYRQALAFVYPSIYEGFGIPILEAFTMKCPTILSDIGSFREVAQDAGIYFNPNDISMIKAQIKWVLDPDNKSKIEEKIKQGTHIAHSFTLDNTYEKTYEVYEAVIKEK
ncbi:MAG: glycosyltransferase family 1 protein [Firmicutes bacterium HGW-Firmicutes-2]|jgi:glycosyltransferase involved in cell wall biosynthesis|nr:MAG: glycosyltransferase family 1 protein [Firmicutes bacterium HGW-Firmicutes-2]